MQSNLHSEDFLFNYWNEFDGGPTNYTPAPLFENGYGFIPPPPPVGLPCTVDPMIPVACIATMMGPIPQRGYGAIQPVLPTPLQSMGPGTQAPPHHYSFHQQPQPTPPQLHFPPDPAFERTQLNHLGQLEQVVVKNGQVFHISFLDEPDEPIPPATLPMSGNEEVEETEENQSRDWINYDELPLFTGTESEDGSYQCDTCSKILKSALNLYVHKQTHKTTRLDCNICGKRFNRIGKLEHHTRRHLSTEQSGSTPICPPASPVLHNFNNYCVECEEFFINTEELHSHMERNHRLIDDSHSNKLKKSIGCPYCNEMFEWPCLLKTHMTKHTGEKPFICERCNVSFRFVQSFYRHNRRVHGHEK